MITFAFFDLNKPFIYSGLVCYSGRYALCEIPAVPVWRLWSALRFPIRRSIAGILRLST